MLGLIGGSGLCRLHALEIDRYATPDTAYGEPSAPLCLGRLGNLEVAFLPRHGVHHRIPPHRVNYRANIAAMAGIGVRELIGVSAVGGISDHMTPGTLCIPDQIIDYTWGRSHTYSEGHAAGVAHVDFTHPYCEALRLCLAEAAANAGLAVVDKGTCGITQGPRLETAAEIRRLARDGCDLVGMTGMPEAGLARERSLCHANLSLVVNRAAGLGDGLINAAEIETHLHAGMQRAVQLLRELRLPAATDRACCACSFVSGEDT